jgi:hypothetical protein
MPWTKRLRGPSVGCTFPGDSVATFSHDAFDAKHFADWLEMRLSFSSATLYATLMQAMLRRVGDPADGGGIANYRGSLAVSTQRPFMAALDWLRKYAAEEHPDWEIGVIPGRVCALPDPVAAAVERLLHVASASTIPTPTVGDFDGIALNVRGKCHDLSPIAISAMQDLVAWGRGDGPERHPTAPLVPIAPGAALPRSASQIRRDMRDVLVTGDSDAGVGASAGVVVPASAQATPAALEDPRPAAPPPLAARSGPEVTSPYAASPEAIPLFPEIDVGEMGRFLRHPCEARTPRRRPEQ